MNGIDTITATKAYCHYGKMLLLEKVHPFRVPAGGKFSQPQVRIDQDGYIMATPEPIAIYHAQRLAAHHLVEICAGGGASTVQFARFSDLVTAIEIDLYRVRRCIPHNALVYGVADKVRPIWGNALDESLLKSLPPVNTVFMDPDWIEDNPRPDFPVASTTPPIPDLLEKVNRLLTYNVGIKMTKMINLTEVRQLGACETEFTYWGEKLKFIMVYFGGLAHRIGTTAVFFDDKTGKLSKYQPDFMNPVGE